MVAAASRWSPAVGKVVDLVLPPRCAMCGDLVGRQGDLCAVCWPTLRFLAAPVCDRCGIPLPEAGHGACPACYAEPPHWDRARGALRYDEASARLILGFKNGGRFQSVPGFARWMARAGAPLLDGADLLVPVPLHRWRLWQRGHNQSAILAHALARLCGVRVDVGLLLRVRATQSQRGLGAGARARNITRAAFAVAPRRLGAVDGRKVVLVDDVLTTGSTLGACAAVLREAGAASVDAVVLARVARDSGAHISGW